MNQCNKFFKKFTKKLCRFKQESEKINLSQNISGKKFKQVKSDNNAWQEYLNYYFLIFDDNKFKKT